MAIHNGKHSGNDLPHGAKMPGVGTKQNSKTVAPSGGNTKGSKFSDGKAPAAPAVNQNYSVKPFKAPKGGHTS